MSFSQTWTRQPRPYHFSLRTTGTFLSPGANRAGISNVLVCDLNWYQGLKQNEAAAVLNVSSRTVTRRWQAACLKLHRALQGILPGS
jgi:hypothetical protein